MNEKDFSEGSLDAGVRTETNFRLREATWQLLKEYVLIFATLGLMAFFCTVLWLFTRALLKLIDRAIYFHSAPIKMVDLIDWHFIFLGTALVAAPTLLAAALLRSVFTKAQHSTDSDGLGLLAKIRGLVDGNEVP